MDLSSSGYSPGLFFWVGRSQLCAFYLPADGRAIADAIEFEVMVFTIACMPPELTPSFSLQRPPRAGLGSSLPQQQPEIGQLIRDLRQSVGSTQEQFAAALGVSFSTLNRWENGHMQPSPLALRQVESVLADLSQSPDGASGSKALLTKYGILGS